MGPIVEPALVQSMYLSDATSYGQVFFGSTVDIVLIVLTVLSVTWVLWMQIKESKQARANKAAESLSATFVKIEEEAACEE